MNQFLNFRAVALLASAAALALSMAARAGPLERIEVIGQPNGCTVTYREVVSDRGVAMSSVALSCPKADRAAQIAERPDAPGRPTRPASGTRQ